MSDDEATPTLGRRLEGAEWRKALADLRQWMTPTDMEARYRRADGQWRTVMTRRVLLRDGAGRPAAFIGVARVGAVGGACRAG